MRTVLHPFAPTAVATGVGLALMAAVPAASANDSVRFGYQPWPGVTVKTEVAAQILEAMGHDVEVEELDPQFVYQGMQSDDVDATLGTWMPAHEDMLEPLLADEQAERHAVNLDEAIQGLTVPEYVREQGIESVSDLVAEGEMFDHNIYAIEAGAGMTRNFQEAVADDYKGLGEWEVLPSSTSGMLAQVERSVSREEPIVFHGWRPHWMDLEYELHFIADHDSTLEQGAEIAEQESTVYTVVRTAWPETNPEAARFLEQFQVEADHQSEWIEGFTRDERDADVVAREWIEAHPEVVAAWLDGVATTAGDPAAEAVADHFDH